MGGSAVRELKQVIGGKVYNTETADRVASDEYWDGSNHHRGGRNMVLYKTKKGNFFLGHFTCWQGELDYLEPVDLSEAKDYYEQLPEKAMEYAAAFGEEPEEA